MSEELKSNFVCFSCRWFKQYPHNTREENGQCVRFPPTIMIDDDEIHGHRELLTVFPEVSIQDFCGEHSEKPSHQNYWP